jgi:hypothetical protein
LKFINEAEIQTPGYLWWNLLLCDLCDLFFTYHSQKSPTQVCSSPSQFTTVIDIWKILWKHKHTASW